jgi:hypothetical protein
MTDRVHTAVSTTRSDRRATVADTPVFKVMPTSEWYARVAARRPTFWQRLLGRGHTPMPLAVLPRCAPGQASAAPLAASPSHPIAAVEAGSDQANDDRDG